MTTHQAVLLIDQLKNKGVEFEPGLTNSEVEQAEQKFGLCFPPDLKLFLQTALPVSDGFYGFSNWRLGITVESEYHKIKAQLDWPLEGMLFDVEPKAFWPDNWGPQPADADSKIAMVKRYYKNYPQLIPICSHRYISASPWLAGNPVFSVYQTDIIYYGFDLATYFADEFHFKLPQDFSAPEHPRHIEFWSDVAEDKV